MTLFVGKCKDMFVSKYKYMLPKFQKYLSLLEEIMSVKCKMNAGSTWFDLRSVIGSLI